MVALRLLGYYAHHVVALRLLGYHTHHVLALRLLGYHTYSMLSKELRFYDRNYFVQGDLQRVPREPRTKQWKESKP